MWGQGRGEEWGWHDKKEFSAQYRGKLSNSQGCLTKEQVSCTHTTQDVQSGKGKIVFHRRYSYNGGERGKAC